MKKLNLFLFATLLVVLVSCSDKKGVSQDKQENQADISDDGKLHVMFYNVENLFDTIDDPLTRDEEFLPKGKKAWTQERYLDKLDKLSKVISSTSNMPDIIGLCEVENRQVVADLAGNKQLVEMGYSVIHKDSPDGRGIDVAMLVNKNKVEVIRTDYIKTKLPVGDRPNTRLIIHATTIVNDDTLHVYVNHWPSRYGGQEESEPNRMQVALSLKRDIDILQKNSPNAHVIIMGDFNDYPPNNSLNKVLRAGFEESRPLINLMWEKDKFGEGTYNYRGDWGCLDQFIVSSNMTNGTASITTSTDDVVLLKHDWMLYTNDKGEVYPSRTYGGPNYYGGYSDHLPIYLQLNLK